MNRIHGQHNPQIDKRESLQREDTTPLNLQSRQVNNVCLVRDEKLFVDVHSTLAGQPLEWQPVKPLSAREQRLKDIRDALAGKPIASERLLVKPLSGREQRLKDIQDALAGRSITSEKHSSTSTKENIPFVASLSSAKPLTGRERRLKEIQDALAGIPVTSETNISQPNGENLPPDQPGPPMSAKPLTGCETRLRDIQGGKDAASGSNPTNTSTVSAAKRPCCSASPESPPPPAKRCRLSSPLELTAKVSSSHTRPAAMLTTILPTPRSSNASLQSEESSEVQCGVDRMPRQRSVDDHIDAFFSRYEEFPYNPSGKMMDEFYRMCDFFRWQKDDDERVIARGLFHDAIAQEFNAIYGTDVDDIRSWRSLCRVLGIVPIPNGLQECRDVVAMTHVNIVDLVEIRHSSQPLEIFSSQLELSQYTKGSGKFYPKGNAYAGGLLRFLLRHIHDPSIPHRSRSRRS